MTLDGWVDVCLRSHHAVRVHTNFPFQANPTSKRKLFSTPESGLYSSQRLITERDPSQSDTKNRKSRSGPQQWPHPPISTLWRTCLAARVVLGAVGTCLLATHVECESE